MRLGQLVAQVEGIWSIDPARRLLTGMSDGATFAYLAGLGPGSPFTHLALDHQGFGGLSSSRWPTKTRLQGLPIHCRLAGALDWMPLSPTPRATSEALTQVWCGDLRRNRKTWPMLIRASSIRCC